MPRTSARSEANGSEKAIPPPIAGRMTDADYQERSIFEAMKRMRPEDWSDKLLYIYRLRPMSVNKTTGVHNYIDKLMEPIDEEGLKATYGGGTFKLLLNGTNPSRTLVSGYAKLPGDPILRSDEVLVTQPEKQPNGATVVQGTNVDDTIKLINAMKDVVAKERPHDDPNAKALSQALDLVAEGAKKGMEISALEAGNKSMSIEKIFDLALKAREPKEDPMLKNLIEPVLRRALEPPPAPKEKSLREWLDELTAVEEVLGTRGRRANPPDSLWSVLATAASKLAEAAPELVRAMRGGNIPPGGMRQQYYPGTVTVGPQPPTLPAAVTPITAAPPGPGQPPGAPVAIDPQFVIKTRIVRAFVDGDNGEFVGWYLQKEAPGLYGAMKGKNVEDVKVFLGGDQILKELLGQDGIDEFLGQVLAYVNEEEPATAETVQ
jgi:hypothetical protein